MSTGAANVMSSAAVVADVESSPPHEATRASRVAAPMSLLIEERTLRDLVTRAVCSVNDQHPTMLDHRECRADDVVPDIELDEPL